MNRVLNIFTVALMAFIGLVFIALSVRADLVTAPPSFEEITAFLGLIKGVGGMSVAGIILLVVQGAMLAVRHFVKGKYLILIVSFLTIVSSVLSAKLQGLDMVNGLLSGIGLTATQVFIHQLINQFKKPE